ncbi:hypothetical protein FBUS_00169 [Fasciolopsis buskii]|uniref:PDZ domain-containing protein n=1 Tax=Fasciolopsis buskii TaxID=27845 RepID=A0A8E0RVC3_9TREM|nr:hypothetical protein FBUS_00169 [Fasciolopsis buski]
MVDELDGDRIHCFTPTTHRAYGVKLHREQPPQRNQSNSTLSFSMPNYSPSIHSPFNNDNNNNTNDNGTEYSPQMQSESNQPRTAVIYYSTKSGLYGNVRATTGDKVIPSDKWPVAKPRQRRLRKPKPVVDTALHQERGWDEDMESSKSSQGNHLIADMETNVRPSGDEEEGNQQWNLFSHLPITTEVIIHKKPGGFGFSIAGGRSMTAEGSEMSTDIFVTRVNPSGAANQDGGLQ